MLTNIPGILVFLTGQNEILALMKRLRQTFPQNNKQFGGRHSDKRPQSQVKVLASEGTQIIIVA
jgi:HrpA-like RNA helicase